MATQSNILAWRIPWIEEPGGLWSRGSQRVGHDWSDLVHTMTDVGYWDSSVTCLGTSFHSLSDTMKFDSKEFALNLIYLPPGENPGRCRCAGYLKSLKFGVNVSSSSYIQTASLNWEESIRETKNVSPLHETIQPQPEQEHPVRAQLKASLGAGGDVTRL